MSRIVPHLLRPRPGVPPKWCGFVLLSALLGSPTRSAAQSYPLGFAYQLTHSQLYDASPSPDGERLVLVSVIGDNEQLFLMNADGSHLVQLTFDRVDHEDPAWSPDGRKIAYVADDGVNAVVMLMNPDGSGIERLGPADIRAIHPSWSWDSKQVWYCTDDDLRPPRKNPSAIYYVDVATKQVRLVIEGGVNTYPSLSPDGKRLLFRRMIGEMNSEVFVANRDGTNQRNLTNHPAFDGWPEWSPDGRRIAFASNRNSNYQIFVMNADGSDVKRVANTEGRATAPHWSRDGKTIYFTNCRKVDLGSDCQIFAGRPLDE
jgi:TolB protein